MTERTVVHLLRHGQVDNPRRVLYGRLPGFHLSDEGLLMAKATARHLATRDITALFSSPLERARETAEPLSEQFGLPIVIDDRLIEAGNHFEGFTFGVGDGSLRRPKHWLMLRNPFRPSWGEPYSEIAARMLAAMATARDAPPAGDQPVSPHRPARAAVLAGAAALAVITGLALSGCAAGQAVQNGPGSGDTNYVGGAVGVTDYRAGHRPTAPPVAGPALTGQRGSLSGYRGQVGVLNFSASWCAPGRSG